MEYPHFLKGNASSKGPFSIAMLDYQSVTKVFSLLNWFDLFSTAKQHTEHCHATYVTSDILAPAGLTFAPKQKG